MSAPADLTGLPRDKLEALVVELLGELADLKRIVAAQRDEIARLKGLKGRPDIRPSGMEKGTEPKRGSKRVKRRHRGKVTPRVMPETEVLRVAHPTGSQFKGYEPYQVQELVLTARVVRYGVTRRNGHRFTLSGQNANIRLRRGLAVEGGEAENRLVRERSRRPSDNRR